MVLALVSMAKKIFFMELKPFEENIWLNVLFVALRVILETIDA